MRIIRGQLARRFPVRIIVRLRKMLVVVCYGRPLDGTTARFTMAAMYHGS